MSINGGFVVLGGSNFRMNTNTASLRQSECTSVPIPQDKSNYWFPVGSCLLPCLNPLFCSITGRCVASLLPVSHWFTIQLTRPFTIINYRWENGSFTSLDGGAVMYVFIFIHISSLFATLLLLVL